MEEVPGSPRHEYTSLLGPSRLLDVIAHVAPVGLMFRGIAGAKVRSIINPYRETRSAY